MYEKFYGLREKPFSLLPDPTFLYPSEKHSMALVLLEYGLSNQTSFSVITGSIGTGKTTLIRQLLSQLGRDVTVGLISNTHRSFGELLQWVLLAFNLDYAGRDKVGMYQLLVDFLIGEYAKNRRTVLIIDEAQNMAPETLEELRMLSNINADKDQVLQIILVGQAGLRETLRRPDLEQFAQRIAVDYNLEPLDLDETRGYIRHRLQVAGGDPELFDAAACEAVYRHSGGTPRLINLLCDTALVFGYAEQATQIHAPLVDDVVHEKLKGGIFPRVQPATSADAPTRAAWPEPTEENASHGGGKKKLRVAVICDAGGDRTTLKNALEKCGLQVVAILPFERIPNVATDFNNADILFVDLNENIDQVLQQLDQLLDECRLPVLYSDSSDTRLGLADATGKFGKRLTLKLASLVRH
jgi:general secretion pathway protein A